MLISELGKIYKISLKHVMPEERKCSNTDRGPVQRALEPACPYFHVGNNLIPKQRTIAADYNSV